MRKSILIVHCSEGAKKALGSMAEAGLRLPAGFRTFELPCTGRVNEAFLMESLQNGVAGIVVLGCRKENCKYLDGNLRAEKRTARVKKLLEDVGAGDRLVEMVFAAPDEGRKLHNTLLAYAERLT